MGIWHERKTGGHYHPDGDEVLLFLGLDPDRPDYLGAEIEITMEDERHLISEPSCVIIPEGLKHGPIVTRKVDKSFGFYMVRLDKGNPSEINPA